MRPIRTAVALALLVLASGCKKPPPPEPVVLKGRVEYAGGKPVDRMVLTFQPADDAGRGNRPVAAVNKGRFEVKCLPGRYKVTLAAVPLQHGAAGPAGGPDAAPGKLPRPDKPGTIPPHYANPETSPWDVTVPEGGKDDLVLTVKW